MRIVGYRLANAVGEVIEIPRNLEQAVAEELLAAGWRLYQPVVG